MAWDFPIDKISATVHLPHGAKILQNACYSGVEGSTMQNCSSKIISDNEIEWQGGRSFKPGEPDYRCWIP